MGKKIVYSINDAGEIGQIDKCRKMYLNHILIPHTGIHSNGSRT